MATLHLPGLARGKSPCEQHTGRGAQRSAGRYLCRARSERGSHAGVYFHGNLSVPLFSVLSPGCSLTLGALTASFAP